MSTGIEKYKKKVGEGRGLAINWNSPGIQ